MGSTTYPLETARHRVIIKKCLGPATRKGRDHEDVSERAGGGRPTKAQAVARTEALLDAARELFCSRGFAGTSIDEIAGVVRSSKHTIYRRYANKLILLEAVVDRDVSRFRDALLAAAAGEEEPVEALRSMARAYFGFSASPGYSALYAAIALESASSAHLRGKLQEWADAALEPMFKAIATAASSGGWRAERENEVCEVLIDLLDGQANRAKWADASTDPAKLDRMFAARWDLFLRAMRWK
jgi:AcrR family transcriptional regulator